MPDGSYSVFDIQNYFEYILKKHGENTDNPSVKIYLNKTENRITFKIKTGYSFEILALLEISEVVLIHCNIVNNDYHQNSRVLYTFVPNKLFGSLLEIYSANHIFLETFNAEFQDIKVSFTDQNSQPLEIEDKINLTLVIN